MKPSIVDERKSVPDKRLAPQVVAGVKPALAYNFDTQSVSRNGCLSTLFTSLVLPCFIFCSR